MNVSVGWEEIVHDDKMDFLAIWHFDSMETIKLREKCVRVVRDVLIVVFQDLT